MVVTGKQTDSKLTKFKYIINERIVILSFSFLCTKIAKCLYNLIYKHLLKKQLCKFCNTQLFHLTFHTIFALRYNLCIIITKA